MSRGVVRYCGSSSPVADVPGKPNADEANLRPLNCPPRLPSQLTHHSVRPSCVQRRARRQRVLLAGDAAPRQLLRLKLVGRQHRGLRQRGRTGRRIHTFFTFLSSHTMGKACARCCAGPSVRDLLVGIAQARQGCASPAGRSGPERRPACRAARTAARRPPSPGRTLQRREGTLSVARWPQPCTAWQQQQQRRRQHAMQQAISMPSQEHHARHPASLPLQAHSPYTRLGLCCRRRSATRTIVCSSDSEPM